MNAKSSERILSYGQRAKSFYNRDLTALFHQLVGAIAVKADSDPAFGESIERLMAAFFTEDQRAQVAKGGAS